MKIGNLSTGVGITYLILTYLYIHENKLLPKKIIKKLLGQLE